MSHCRHCGATGTYCYCYNVAPLLADPHVSPESKAALSIPHEFLKRQDDKHKERRQYKAVPVMVSAFAEFAA